MGEGDETHEYSPVNISLLAIPHKLIGCATLTKCVYKTQYTRVKL